MGKLLSVAADLSAPPSLPTSFRDLTLFASVFKKYEVVAVVPMGESPDPYNIWFKRYGLWDFVEDLVMNSDLTDTKVLVQIEGGPNAKLTPLNLSQVLLLL